MAGTGDGGATAGRAARTAVRYGLKYGPIVYEALKRGKEPAKQLAQRAWQRQAARRRAFQHAESVVDGSVLRTFHQDEPVWVVYSGETPLACHPEVEVALDTLVRYADPGARIRADDIGRGGFPPTDVVADGVRRTGEQARKLPEVARRVVGRRDDASNQ